MSSSIAELIAAYSPPDTGPGEEPGEVEVPGSERERGRHRGDDVDEQGQQEQLLAAEAVGELTEEQRTQARSGDVDRCGDPDLAGVELDAAALFDQPRGHRADHRDLEAVEDPDGAQPDDDSPVEPRPGQPVQPCGDPGADRAGLHRATHAIPPVPAAAPGMTWMCLC